MRPQDMGMGRLFESVRDAVIVAEANTGRIVLWNSAATKIFGYSASEASNELRIEALVPEHLKARHHRGMAHYRDTGHGPYIDSNTVLDLPALCKTGEQIRIELTLSPIEPIRNSADEGPLEGPEGRFVLAIVRDVTDRKQAQEQVRWLNEDLERRVEERTTQLEAAAAKLENSEQTLRESEERYRLLVESVKEYAIFMVGTDGRVASWNAGAERLFGYSE